MAQIRSTTMTHLATHWCGNCVCHTLRLAANHIHLIVSQDSTLINALPTHVTRRYFCLVRDETSLYAGFIPNEARRVVKHVACSMTSTCVSHPLNSPHANWHRIVHRVVACTQNAHLRFLGEEGMMVVFTTRVSASHLNLESGYLAFEVCSRCDSRSQRALAKTFLRLLG